MRMSVERSITVPRDIHVPAAAGSVKRKRKKHREDRALCFHSTPCSVPAGFLSGSQPGASWGDSANPTKDRNFPQCIHWRDADTKAHRLDA